MNHVFLHTKLGNEIACKFYTNYRHFPGSLISLSLKPQSLAIRDQVKNGNQ